MCLSVCSRVPTGFFPASQVIYNDNPTGSGYSTHGKMIPCWLSHAYSTLVPLVSPFKVMMAPVESESPSLSKPGMSLHLAQLWPASV